MNKIFFAAIIMAGVAGGAILAFSHSSVPTGQLQAVAGIKEDDVPTSTPEMPFECQPLSSGAQERCVDERRKVDDCHDLPPGEGRGACAKQQLGVATTTAVTIQGCDELAGMDKAACVRTVKEKIAATIMFRLNDLEDRAREFAAARQATSSANKIVASLEKAKVDLIKAKTVAARKKVLNTARAAWGRYAVPTRNKALKNDYLNQAFVDIKSL